MHSVAVLVAIMLACLAAKFRWKNKMKQKGKPTDKPNIVFGTNAHGTGDDASLFPGNMNLIVAVPVMRQWWSRSSRDTSMWSLGQCPSTRRRTT